MLLYFFSFYRSFALIPAGCPEYLSERINKVNNNNTFFFFKKIHLSYAWPLHSRSTEKLRYLLLWCSWEVCFWGGSGKRNNLFLHPPGTVYLPALMLERMTWALSCRSRVMKHKHFRSFGWLTDRMLRKSSHSLSRTFCNWTGSRTNSKENKASLI